MHCRLGGIRKATNFFVNQFSLNIKILHIQKVCHKTSKSVVVSIRHKINFMNGCLQRNNDI